MNPTASEFHILLVEDSVADAFLVERALKESVVAHRLTVVSTGKQALALLFGGDDCAASADDRPDLILLDLNLPGLDGCQVLTQIKSDPALRVIPVIILTTSQRDEDVLRTYSAGANSYIAKPLEFSSYRALFQVLNDYWVKTAIKIPRPS
jgi:chemotaxis family two-component system response regulator Rcp1